MKIVFPFEIKQIEKNSVEVVFVRGGGAITHVTYSADVRECLTATECDEIAAVAMRSAIQKSIRIEE